MNKLSLGDKASSKRVNSWVDSSFSDFSERPIVRSGRTKVEHSFGSRLKEKKVQRQKGETSRSDQLTTQRDLDETTWVDRYSPGSQAELAVHKKKIEEVENWMKTHMDASKAGILILTGPSGCGKTATVHVLSQELGIRVQEWTNTFNLEPYSSSQQESRVNVFSCSSQIVQFQDFLLRANKYRCLKMAGDEEATDRKLTLVEDFPNQFYRQPRSLHDMLRCFVRRPQYPLVFVVSDCPSGDGRLQSLFPREIQKELAISCISFNPVPPTTMMKALSCILSLETGKSCRRMFVPDKTELEALCAGSSGDLRSAINSLQFLCLPDTSVENRLCRINKRPAISKDRTVSRANKKMKMTKQMKEQEEHQAIGGKDASLFLFRALGKILHSKRRDPKAANETTGPPGPGLSFHLSHHHREPLLINPELVLERSQMSAEVFSLYLHQNYLDFFCDMEDVDRASEYLSDADLLSADWTSRSILGEYGSSVVSRGLLHSNSHQVSSGFRPLHKPSWFLVSRKHRDNCQAAQCLFRSFCLTPVSLQIQLLPYLAKLSNPLRNQDNVSPGCGSDVTNEILWKIEIGESYR
ncbi:cell cycle checkpoint protein RAD17 isoform X2 [Kryptolebias marmoratus]|uniref:cell cycle checkpoint protein RAD17 isoform X2 n=1 Tax=Kryptolebias marmoratus TaxID=37003 RepID=UPI0018ACE159|nr:cell cycle checkpoint protein RAD17 isoform X2 [Kryptolebias marmoratus]